MPLDMNEKGEDYDYRVIGESNPDYGALSNAARLQFLAISNYCHSESKGVDDAEICRRRQIQGCLDKLCSALMQISRISAYHDTLVLDVRRKLQSSDEDWTFATFPRDTLTDFESLLFQGRAALDRITRLVAAEFGDSGHRFSKLHNLLSNVKNKFSKAQNILSILNDSPPLPGIFVTDGEEHSLRDLVAHYGSISEFLDNYFSVTRLAPGKALILDCEVKGLPLFDTSWKCASFLPFIILNCLALLSDREAMEIAEYDPPWHNLAAVFSEHISTPEAGQRLSAIGPVLGGFRIITKHVDESIFTKYVTVDSS